MAAARGGGGSVQKGAIRGDDSCYQCNTGDTAQYRVAVSKIPLYSMLLPITLNWRSAVPTVGTLCAVPS